MSKLWSVTTTSHDSGSKKKKKLNLNNNYINCEKSAETALETHQV